MIACSRMYNLVPQAKAAWTRLFDWVSCEAEVPLEIIDYPAPAPLEELWAREDMGCVFMCGYPYAMAVPSPVLLAAPVPSPERYGDQPVYFTDLIVHADGPHQTLEDTFGGRVAWTVEHSHSGFNALRHHLLKFRTPDRPTLYAESIGPLISPMRALQSVLNDEADVAPLDSLGLDLLRTHDPDKVSQIRVVDTTAPAAFPPLVAGPDVDPDACARLRTALISIEDAPEMRDALDTVLIERFVPVSQEDYAPLIDIADQAIDAGYDMPR